MTEAVQCSRPDTLKLSSETIRSKEVRDTLRYTAFFADFETDEVSPVFPEAVKAADAIGFAQIGYVQDTVDKYQQISNGTLEPDIATLHASIKRGMEPWGYSRLTRQLATFYQSEKPIFFLGTELSHPITHKYLDAAKIHDIYDTRLFLDNPFPTALVQVKSYFRHVGETMQEYQKHVAEQLEGLPENLHKHIDTNVTNVVLHLPSVLEPQLSSMTLDCDMNLPTPTNYYELAIRKASTGVPIGKEHAAKVLFEIWAATTYKRPKGEERESSNNLRYATAMAQTLTYHEIEEVFRQTASHRRWFHNVADEDFRNAVQGVLDSRLGGEIIPKRVIPTAPYSDAEIKALMR